MYRSELDQIDLKILTILQTDGRIRLNDLAARVSLSPPAARDRLKRLERQDYIQGYSALLNVEKLQLPITALVRVFSDNSDCASVARQILEIDGVRECMRISGDETAIVVVHAKNTSDLERIITKIARFGRTSSSLVLDRRENIISLL